MAYRHVVFAEDYELIGADGMKLVLKALKAAGYQLGLIVTMMEEYEEDDRTWTLHRQFDCVLRNTVIEEEPVLDGRLLKDYLQCYKVDRTEVLFVGSNISDMENATGAGVDCALALWACETPRHVWADYYFPQPYDVWYQLNKITKPFQGNEWVTLAMELQFLAQGGITYTKDFYDKERFTRIREIAAEVMEMGTGLPIEHIKDVFCNETGFQTPKLDSRAAIFRDDKILLVREKGDGQWSLPGGWVDVNETIAGNTVKEVKEEAGLDVVPVRLIALQDRNQHNTPPYAYGICKAFMLCDVISGEFERNMETDASAYFGRDELPPLSLEKVTEEQIQMCFDAYQDEQWTVLVD